MKDINLYINNQEVEFSTTTDILFTYQQDDLTNPTVVKNNFSKTVIIKGTPKNNKIFGEIWNVERIQGSDNFNVSKRVPFSLYVNGDLFTTGYAKLDKVNMVGNDINYSITLYGGLGSFLYNLAYDWNTGDKKTLKDLRFFKGSHTTEEFDFDFNINKDTVDSAWTWSNMSDSSSEWYHINFAPSYIGTPDNISSDKVLINFNQLPVGTSGATSAGTAYTTYHGYALGTLPKNMTQEETRDFRAYLQTPIVRCKSVFDAICRKENNQGLYDNGFDVELDSDFFNTSNPYYWDSWMTLPLITSLEVSKTGEPGGSTAYTGSVYSTVASNGGYEYTFLLPETITGGGYSIKAVFDLSVSANTNVDTLYLYYTKVKGRGERIYRRNAYAVQLYASNSIITGGNALAGSHIKWLTGDQKLEYNTAVASGYYTPKYVTTVDNYEGTFNRVALHKYNFSTQMEVSCDLPVGSTCFKLNIGRINSTNSNENTMLFTSTVPTQETKVETNLIPFDNKTMTISKGDESGAFSNRKVTKDLLLDTSYSPADWLLSYIKMFGLYIYKDEIDDKIYIKTRNNFYDRDVNHISDIEHLIDRGNSTDLNPVYCQYAHLELKNDTEKSRPEQDYESKYNKVYGEKIVNTGYEFNADTKNIFENNVFRGAVQSKEVSDMFYKPSNGVQPYYWNNIAYNLYENGEATGSTYEIKPGTVDIATTFQPYDNSYPGYDYIGKPMFANADRKTIDNSNVLLFFNGYENVEGFNWILSDDVSEMFTLNNNPCWLMSVSTANTNGVEICKKISQFPLFGRMYEGNNWMIYSWDLGSPRELYIPSIPDNPEANIYHNYFKSFYADLYDIDTKVIDCYVKPGLIFNNEDLRKLYWFRNRLWRLNKVTDYNPTNYNTTKCQFISVNDINSLTNEDATTDLRIKIELEKYVVNSSGETIVGTVTTSDNYGWNYEGCSISPSGGGYYITVEPTSFGSSGNFTVTLPENVGSDRDIKLYFTAGDIGGSVSFTQEGFVPYINLSPPVIFFNSSGGTARIEVDSNVDWETSVVNIRKTTGITIDNLVCTSDVPASGGTASSANCSYSVTAHYDDGTSGDVTSISTISGSLIVSATTSSTRRNAGTLTLVATLGDLSASASTTVYQSANSLSSITIDNLIWVEDVSPYGGTATSANCSFVVNAHYTNATTVDVTSSSEIEGYLEVYLNTSTSRRSVGTLTLSARYSGKYGSANVTVYQEGRSSYDFEFLTFDILYGGDIVWVASNGSDTRTIQYSINNGAWNSITSSTGGTSISVSSGDKIRFKGNNYTYSGSMFRNSFSGTTAAFNIYGNIMSLIYGDNFSSYTTLEGTYNFRYLFGSCGNLVSAENLSIPVVEMTYGCCEDMFSYDYALTTPPKILQATTLNTNCYYDMFYFCHSLEKSPTLPAKTLVNGCYKDMFCFCNSLNYIKCLATDISATNCVSGWVDGVSSTGTFVKASEMSNWTSGINGIPVGWTIQNE